MMSKASLLAALPEELPVTPFSPVKLFAKGMLGFSKLLLNVQAWNVSWLEAMEKALGLRQSRTVSPLRPATLQDTLGTL